MLHDVLGRLARCIAGVHLEVARREERVDGLLVDELREPDRARPTVSVETSAFTVNLFCFSHVANGLLATILPTSLSRSAAGDVDFVRALPSA